MSDSTSGDYSVEFATLIAELFNGRVTYVDEKKANGFYFVQEDAVMFLEFETAYLHIVERVREFCADPVNDNEAWKFIPLSHPCHHSPSQRLQVLEGIVQLKRDGRLN